MPRIDPRLVQLAGRTANQKLTDAAIRHSLFLERLKTTQTKRITTFLARNVLPEIHSKVKARLAAVVAGKVEVMGTGLFTTTRYQKMLVSNAVTVRSGIRQARDLFKGDLRNIALTEAEWQAAAIGRAFAPLQMSTVLPSAGTLRVAVLGRKIEGRILREYFERLSSALSSNIRQQIRLGVIQGETVGQIARRMRDGAYTKTLRDARVITRTSVNHVSNRVRQDTYEANSDVVKAWQFLATLDSRTTEICMANDGEVYALGDGDTNRPPLHHQCRSTTVPVLKSWEELGITGVKEAKATTRPFNSATRKDLAKIKRLSGGERRALRASLTGAVPAKQSYLTWLRGQPAAVQNEALGFGKAKLFRAGKYKPTVRNTLNRPGGMTLKQLRAKEGLAPLE